MPDLDSLHTDGGDPRFFTVLEELAVIHRVKAADYGTEDPLTNLRNSSEFGIPDWVGCMLRANDKMRRIKSMAIKGKLANESLEDSLLDLASYSILGLILFRESQSVSKSVREQRTMMVPIALGSDDGIGGVG